MHRLGGAERVRGRRQLHADGRNRLAVDARRSRVILAADFDARHIAQPHHRTVGIGAQHDGAELLDGRQLAGRPRWWRKSAATRARQIAQRAGGDLRILGLDRGRDIGRSQLVADQLGRIDPDPHRAFGAEQLGLADARHALDFIQHVARHIIAQRHRIELAVCRRQRDEHQEVAARLGDLHALLRDRLRQARFDPLQAVLHVHRGQIGIGAGAEGDA